MQEPEEFAGQPGHRGSAGCRYKVILPGFVSDLIYPSSHYEII